MKNELQQKLKIILKKIIQQIKESFESCQTAIVIEKHHRVSVKNIEINLLEIQKNVQQSELLKNLYTKAKNDLKKFKKYIKQKSEKNKQKISENNRIKAQEENQQTQQYLQKIDQIQAENNTLKRQVSKLQDQFQQYQIKTKKCIKNLQGQIEQLTQQNNKLELEILKLKTTSKKKQTQIEKIKQGFKQEEVKQDRKKQLMYEEIVELRKQLKKMECQKFTLSDKCRELNEEIVHLNCLKTEHQQHMDQVLFKIQSQIQNLNQKLILEKKEKDEKSSKIEILKQQVSQAQYKLKQSEQCIYLLKQANSNIKQKLEKYQDDQNQRENEYYKLKTLGELNKTEEAENKRDKIKCLGDIKSQIIKFKYQQRI